MGDEQLSWTRALFQGRVLVMECGEDEYSCSLTAKWVGMLKIKWLCTRPHTETEQVTVNYHFLCIQSTVYISITNNNRNCYYGLKYCFHSNHKVEIWLTHSHLFIFALIFISFQ